MSDCRWCDYGDHPYKAGQEGTTMLGQVVKAPNGQLMQANTQEVREVCPEHSAELGLYTEYKAPALSPDERKALLAALARDEMPAKK
jgi:hypothetical protein